MKRVTLTFTNRNYIDGLMNDREFITATSYLNHIRLNDLNIVFNDPVPEHDRLDSEATMLTICARATKRLFFNNEGDMQYNVPSVLELKGGINHNGRTPVVSSTAVQLG